jgi:hypothetical protein
MTLEALLFQGLNGLAAASGLFFVGAGLSLIFGVSRICGMMILRLFNGLREIYHSGINPIHFIAGAQMVSIGVKVQIQELRQGG